MVLWCNLHAGFIIGLVFAGLLAIEAVAEARGSERLQVAWHWGVFIALATGASLISPNGISPFTMTLELLRMHMLTQIQEWHGVDFTTFQPVVVWIALAILGGYSLGVKLPLSRTAMVLLLLYEALAHQRNQELLGFIAPLLVAAPLAAVMPAGASDVVRRNWKPGGASVLIATIVLGFFSAAFALDRQGVRPPEIVAPVGALDAARAARLTTHVFNSYRFGGYLAFNGIPTFIDGRADLFGNAFIKQYLSAVTGLDDELPSLLNRYKIRWMIFEPKTAVVTILDHLPGWERIYADRYAVVFRRRKE